MTFNSSTEDNDIDFKVKTFLNDAKNWSNFRYKIKLRLNKVNKTKQAVIIEDDGPTMTSVPLQNAISLSVASFMYTPPKNVWCGWPVYGVNIKLRGLQFHFIKWLKNKHPIFKDFILKQVKIS